MTSEIGTSFPQVASGGARPERSADHFVRILEDAGAEVLFGLPGGAISPLHDALLDSSIRVITTRSEAGAMFAAAGYARATGKIGVVAVTSGPGALNALTGLASAWCDSTPLLLVIGEVPRSAQGRGVLQDSSAHGLQVVEMARHVSKLAVEIAHPSSVPHLLRHALEMAQADRKGPVVLTFPLDVGLAPAVTPRFGGDVRLVDLIADDMLDEIARRLAGAKRPLLFAGNGCRGARAPELLAAVAEISRCPVMTTPKGKGVFPESHPLALGVFGLGGHGSASDYVEAGVDVMIAIGTSLGDLATNGFSPLLQTETLVHVDVDASRIGRSYEPTHALTGSATTFLEGLRERLPPGGPEREKHGVERQRLPSSIMAGALASHDAVLAIQSTLPPDTVFTADSGEHSVFATHFLALDRPDQWLVMTGLGSMGQSIGAALGAQLAHPGRMIAAICGDACFAMNAFEVSTAVAEKLPIRVFVFDDERMTMVEHGHEHVYGRRPSYPTMPLDVCAIARGLGATALRVDRPGQIEDARDLLRDAPGPVVVGVRIDPMVRLQKQDRVAVMATKSRLDVTTRGT